jgi:hypothetical protein
LRLASRLCVEYSVEYSVECSVELVEARALDAFRSGRHSKEMAVRQVEEALFLGACSSMTGGDGQDLRS